ncbi:MAG TPA: hypothetical protein PKE49_13535 [Leptospiraceae bacterium]|nr:hypothetical protein [Leptospirales bacterium]HMW59365.1 hypothetical protein [Leptospiraceae bacterium]HMX57541.1 hypothetical protein [Leptospiraceae bacterium]HMZ37016.1 hypothetical protein [Leptospiraceae bacterium]HNE24105.1 hypothetical protein [Leptospiraceae bacterium]
MKRLSTIFTIFIFFVGAVLPGCKKEEKDHTSEYALIVLFAASFTRTFSFSCNKFSVNSSCTNYYGFGTSSATCTSGGGTVSTSKCSNLSNYGTCTTAAGGSGSSEFVFYSGGTNPVCGSAGACQTNCTAVGSGTYSSTYTP